MTWQDDSWRDGYDEWKLRSPYDDVRECEHDDPDLDVIEGRFHCDCGYSWNASADDIQAQVDRQREYDQWQARENRRERWRRFTHPIRWPIFRLLELIMPSKAYRVLYDEEIPF